MRTVTVSGTNLWRVAAEELGDASQWWRIARLNGMTDPEVRGVRTLVVPDRNPSMRGGLPED